MTGTAGSQSGALGRPPLSAVSIEPRNWFTSSAPAGAANASGSTISTAVSSTMIPAAQPRLACRCVRTQANTGQVV